MISLVLYGSVLVIVLSISWYLQQPSRMPVVPRKHQEDRITNGDCPGDGCGGKTYLLGADALSTLWRCVDCRATYLLTALPRE